LGLKLGPRKETFDSGIELERSFTNKDFLSSKQQDYIGADFVGDFADSWA
jgi:hypothetical protein